MQHYKLVVISLIFLATENLHEYKGLVSSSVSKFGGHNLFWWGGRGGGGGGGVGRRRIIGVHDLCVPT